MPGLDVLTRAGGVATNLEQMLTKNVGPPLPKICKVQCCQFLNSIVAIHNYTGDQAMCLGNWRKIEELNPVLGLEGRINSDATCIGVRG